MTRDLDRKIQECLDMAAENDALARRAADPTVKLFYETVAKSWGHVADNYRFILSMQEIAPKADPDDPG